MKVFSYIVLCLSAALAVYLFTASFLFMDITADDAAAARQRMEIPDAASFNYHYTDEEIRMMELGLVDVSTYNRDILIRLSYNGPDNFTGMALSPDIHHAFLIPQVAEKLAAAQQILMSLDSTLRLVVLDAARPRHLQSVMWDWAVANDMRKYIAAPSIGSVHNYGAAVDVTIMGVDSLLDMGGVHDAFGPEAEPRFHSQMLAEGRLTEEQVRNRELLREVMRAAGFQAIQTEWWHFNGLSKAVAEEYFRLIE